MSEYEYCTKFNVETFGNIKYNDYKSTIENELSENPEVIEKYKDIQESDRPKALYEDMIKEFIVMASGMVNDYCQTTFDDDIPESIKGATIKIVINMINSNRTDRNSRVINNDNYTIEYKSTNFIDRNIELLLKPFILSNQARCDIDSSVITGCYPYKEDKCNDW